jgi:uncharacterized protein YgbK (DUF1537 family)
LLLTYYGDDFTGSTDVLEALHTGGIEAVLFVTPPSSEALERYQHVRAFGIAGNSRMMSPAEMDKSLPEVFRSLYSHRPKTVHYKTCSTFDSSPEIGSIGRATDIGQRIFQNRLIPMVVGSPALGRYCVFGNLFAKSGLNTDPFRLDRHPSMPRHPVTPMSEADLRLHLAQQTSRPVELVDVLTLDQGFNAARTRLERIQESGAIVLFDTLTTDHLEAIGRLICDLQEGEQKPLFVVGSSGIDYALVKHWQSSGIASAPMPIALSSPAKQIESVDRTIILSGSCSPVTDRQINWALKHGFAQVAVDTRRLANGYEAIEEHRAVAEQVISLLGGNQSVIVHTSRGPSDARLVASQHNSGQPAGGTLGAILAQILHEVLSVCTVRRVAIVGGDTAGQFARSLGVEAVEMIGPLEPGAPLCVVHCQDKIVDGLEVTFKGGQVGYDDFFGTLLSGQRKPALVGAN